ncbi:hypothetical protein [Pedobacter sp. SL55]|uniref:hypothetical protein n=1 Tax=Pedobacter sp. SL55 TaxID=2995161 RepID=UPI00226E5B34|nr:hypothetical protein [Pedobacter sp. SL55]WAC42056.1 hypothetical protein OVA16_06770 [Pedobacter sp. SL55]
MSELADLIDSEDLIAGIIEYGRIKIIVETKIERNKPILFSSQGCKLITIDMGPNNKSNHKDIPIIDFKIFKSFFMHDKNIKYSS